MTNSGVLDRWLNKIICGDCLEVMREMPDKCVDLVLTDPPYGIGETHKKNNSRGRPSKKWPNAKYTDYGEYTWDDRRVSQEIFVEMQRISINQIIFGGNYYIDFLHPSPCWIVWDKDNGGSDFDDCELAWTSFKSAVRKFQWRWNGLIQQDQRNKESRVHPTQKPIPLFRWILRRYSTEGQTILDPFLGSGTTAIAAAQLGRNFIGIEIDPTYCAIAEQRLKRETAQQNMFHAPSIAPRSPHAQP